MAGEYASIIVSIDEVIAETFSKTVMETAPRIDGIWKRMVRTSRGVSRSDGPLGRDYKIKHIVKTGMSGAARWRSTALGPTTSNVEAHTPQVRVWSAGTTFPSVGDAASPGYHHTYLQMAMLDGTILMPPELTRADRLDATLVTLVKDIMGGSARNVSNLKAITWYNKTTDGSSKAIAKVSSDTTPSGTNTRTVSVTDARLAHLYIGQMVDVLDASASFAKLNTASNWVITNVDRVAKTITIGSVDSTVTHLATVTTDDLIVVAGSHPGTGSASAPAAGYGADGLFTWIATSGNVFNLSTTTVPWLKSKSIALSAVLTDAVLMEQIEEFFDERGTDLVNLDTLLTTRMARVAYLENVDGQGIYQRQGQALMVRPGWKMDDVFVNDAMTLDWLTSRYMQSGVAVVLKTKEGNLKEYHPPKRPGVGSEQGFDDDIEFVAPAMGSTRIWMPTRNTSNAKVTDMAEAPFVAMLQWGAKQPQSIEFTSVTEASPASS